MFHWCPDRQSLLHFLRNYLFGKKNKHKLHRLMCKDLMGPLSLDVSSQDCLPFWKMLFPKTGLNVRITDVQVDLKHVLAWTFETQHNKRVVAINHSLGGSGWTSGEVPSPAGWCSSGTSHWKHGEISAFGDHQ